MAGGHPRIWAQIEGEGGRGRNASEHAPIEVSLHRASIEVHEPNSIRPKLRSLDRLGQDGQPSVFEPMIGASLWNLRKASFNIEQRRGMSIE